MNRAAESAAGGNVYPHLRFIAAGTGISGFFSLLQQGVLLKTRGGCSITAFLREEIGVAPDAMERIQSVFLDGRPVDDLDSAIIKEGSSLALSAAMPGLVGATLRRGGAYASFRSTITYRDTGVQCAPGEGFVQIKLFNLLMDELGPGLLEKGIFIKSLDVADFLKGRSPDFWKGFRQVLLDGAPAGRELGGESAWFSRQELIRLSVTSEERDNRTVH